jgi:O-antigen/teichoic acid export membrane protein
VSQADKHLPRGTLYLSLGQGAFVLSGYIVHMILGRWLTPALFGVFSVTMTVLVWVEITVNNGVPVALQKFLPDRSLAPAPVLRAAARCQASIAIAVFLIMFLAAPWLAILLRDPTLTGYLRLAFVDILAMAAYAYYRGTLNGWRFFRQLSLTIGAYSLAKLAAICLLILLGLGVQGALIGNIIASLGGLAVGYFWTRRHRGRQGYQGQPSPPAEVEPPAPSEPGQTIDERAAPASERAAPASERAAPASERAAPASERAAPASERAIMAFVLPAALFTLVSNVLLGLDLMGVKALVADANQVGYYSAAVKLAEAPRLVLLAFSFTLLPALSHAIASLDQAQTRHYLQQIIRMLALVLLPLLALVTATAEPLITLTFTAAYQPAAPILTVLIFTYTIYTVYITLVTALLAENRPGRALAIPLALLPAALGAVWWGASRFGTLGAACASLVSVTLAATIVTGYVLRRFRPACGAARHSLARAALASALVGVLAWLWAPTGLMLLVAYGLLGGLYLALLLLLRELQLQDVVQAVGWFSSAQGEERKEHDARAA